MILDQLKNKQSVLLQTHDAPSAESFPQAAVLVPIVLRDGDLFVFYTQRAPWLKRHAGEVAFPGGRLEKGETFAQAAAREAYEEAGVPQESIQVLGYLPSLISISDFRVVPVVGLIDTPFTPAPDGQEVTHTFEVPLSHVLNPNIYTMEERVHSGVTRQTYAFTFEGYRIWGLTGLLSQALAMHFQDKTHV